MVRFILFFCVFSLVRCEDDREPKFFFGQKNTVMAHRKVSEYVTEFIPSSCIVIEETLLPCRHVRNLEIYPSVPTRVMRTKSPQIQNFQREEIQNLKPVQPASETVQHRPTPPLHVRPQIVKKPAQPWSWNFFNIFRAPNVTYTATKTEFITTKVQDPNTVVSFYVKGCRPSKLPFDLPECIKPEEVTENNKNIVVMAPLKFVPAADQVISPSKTENITVVEGNVENVDVSKENVSENGEKKIDN